MQLCADAEERQAHVDGKILRVLVVQIIRVRIVGVRERLEIRLEHIGAVPVGGHVEIPAVMAGQRVGNLGIIGFGKRLDDVIGRGKFAV